MSQIEREDFGWDHAQASAWILKSWGFPDDTVSLAGAHNLTTAQVLELGLDRTIALPLATASILPSVLRPSEERARLLVETTRDVFALSAGEFTDLVSELQVSFGETREQFDLGDGKAGDLLTSLISLSESSPKDSS